MSATKRIWLRIGPRVCVEKIEFRGAAEYTRGLHKMNATVQARQMAAYDFGLAAIAAIGPMDNEIQSAPDVMPVRERRPRRRVARAQRIACRAAQQTRRTTRQRATQPFKRAGRYTARTVGQ